MSLFRIGLSRVFLASDGTPAFDAQAWRMLQEAPGIEVAFLDGPAESPVTREDVRQYDALLIKRNPVVASLFGSADDAPIRLRLLARNGVGYDHIDIAACTRAGVMVSITPEAVARPVASAVMAMLLAFSHRLFERDRLTREGRWNERWNRPGMALAGRTLGVVGLGNIGCELLRLAAPWGMHHLAFTPRPRPERYAGLDVALTTLESLLEQADFVALCCPLNVATRGMIDAAAFARMQPHAFLVNTARGEVVNEADLVDALRSGRIAGAGIDVFATEPPRNDNPLFGMDNVIVGSHNLAFTDELNTMANRSIAKAALRVASNAVPSNVINPLVLRHPRLAGLSPLSEGIGRPGNGAGPS